MAYSPPVSDLSFVMKHIAEWRRGLDAASLSSEDVSAILREAGAFAADVVAPLNRPADTAPTELENGVVRTPDGWRDAYSA